MPTLNWLGKDAVLKHHVPYRTLELKESFNCDLGKSENKIIQGDNLEALKALLPEYEGRIKCIYIDPPYNTGASPDKGGWVYYDNVDSPKIRKWIKQVVGKEFDDLNRHDKWLCMMYPRLKLLHRLLDRNGFIAISIDDNELINLACILDEIFGYANRLACVPVLSEPSGGKAKEALRIGHEYILLYIKRDNDELKYETKKVEGTIHKDEFGEYIRGRELSKWGSESLKTDRPDMWFAIQAPDGSMVYPYRNDGLEGRWRWGRDNPNMIELLNNPNCPCVYWEKRKFDNGIVVNGETERIFPYEKIRVKEKELGWSTWLDKIGFNSIGTSELKNIFGTKNFDTPKPTTLVQWVVNLMKDSNGIVLDSFAGSGTTAHAVLNLNKQDGGNRKFILIEMEDYADKITAERVRRVIKGYKADELTELYSQELTPNNLKNASDYLEEIKAIRAERKDDFDSLDTKIKDNTLKLYGKKKGYTEGLGGDFNYYKLGPEMIINGILNEQQPIEKIREYIFHSETRTPIDQDKVEKAKHDYFLGDFDNTAYYFFYKKNEITTLDFRFLSTIHTKSERYVIFADNCVLPKDFLFKHNIIFKKIPRDVRRF
ncbi:site-specific DNA-methyltransferase [Fibrobacter sp.]|uniref:site-specific DNA-methyltransferase n=1 Tax=Fibrobacter sp. TaxID=35828 RepID=UPI003868F076